jgi:hypothetical protein
MEDNRGFGPPPDEHSLEPYDDHYPPSDEDHRREPQNVKDLNYEGKTLASDRPNFPSHHGAMPE